MSEVIQDFLAAHEAMLGWLGLLSLLMFFGSAVAIPWILVRLPADYFASSRPSPWRRGRRSPLLHLPLRLLKNLAGLALLLLGLLLLVLPGQGLLTILIGVALLDFPRKYELLAWLLGRPGIRDSANWLRRKYARPPLRF